MDLKQLIKPLTISILKPIEPGLRKGKFLETIRAIYLF